MMDEPVPQLSNFDEGDIMEYNIKKRKQEGL
jgi:hypothetical protein